MYKEAEPAYLRLRILKVWPKEEFETCTTTPGHGHISWLNFTVMKAKIKTPGRKTRKFSQKL
jgi:hypothetical protein